MKNCPKCHTDYFDNMLEFCLEDGTKLISVRQTATATKPNQPNQLTDETVNLPFSGDVETLDFRALKQENKPLAETEKSESLKQAQKGNKILEIAPIVAALTHNWWQWLYLNNQYYSSLPAFLLSANFLMWLLLLAASAIVGLLALKRCQNKSFAIVSLVILSINFLLFLVPKR